MSKRVKEITLWAIVIVIYYIAFQLFYNMVAFKTPYPYVSLKWAVYGVTLNFIPVLTIFLLNAAIVFKLVRITNIKKKILVDAVTSYAVSILFNVVFLMLNKGHYVDWAGTLFNNTLTLLLLEVYYYVTRYLHTQEQLSQQRQVALQYQYDALKAQVNPHFLFNSLSILYALVQQDQKLSLQFIDALSQMYRYIMKQQGKETVPLSEEMEFLDNYVSVLKMRYVNQFEVDIEGREHIGTKRVVPYTVQLLLENVTKHNVISSRQPMRVSIVIGEDQLTMTNPIRPRNTSSSTGIGLRYLTELYQLHNKEFTTTNDGQSFTVQVQYL